MHIGRNASFNLLGFLCPAAILFVSYPLLLHALGVERFGVLALAMSLAAGLSFLDLGLSAASLRFIVSDLYLGENHAAARVIGTTLTFFCGLGIFISTTLFVLSPSVANWIHIEPSQFSDAIIILRLTAPQIACSLFLGTLASIFKALNRFDLAAVIASLVATMMYGVPAFQVAYFDSTLPTAVGTAIIGLLILSTVGILLLDREANRNGITLRECTPDVKTFRRIFSFGATLTGHAIIGMLFTHGQRILVGFMFGPASLAAYQLSLTLVSKVHAAINAVAEVALPVASRAQTNLIKKHYFRSMLALSAMSFFPLLAITMGRHWIIERWLGESAPPLASELLPAACLGYFFVALSALPYHILNGFGKPQINLYFSVLNITIYGIAILVFELIHLRNVVNIALAFAISNAICGVCYQFFCYRLFTNIESQPSTTHDSQ
jgi:O-antigen/teichoic acid export membrane protein